MAGKGDFYETDGPPPEYSAAIGLVRESPTSPPTLGTMKFPVPTKKEVREAFEEYAQTECSRVVRSFEDMKISDIRSNQPVYRYTIEIFSECRTLTQKSEPYIYDWTHQLTSGSAKLARPDKWSFRVAPLTTFADASTVLEVPSSSIIKECTNCSAARYEGLMRCDVCNGHKNMMHWKNLEIQWTTKKETIVISRGLNLSIKKTPGDEIVFEERCSGNQARPIVFDQDRGATDAAERFFRENCSIQNENTKIIEVCQQVEVIPVVEVRFPPTGKFYIIGKEKKVYFPEKKSVGLDYSDKWTC